MRTEDNREKYKEYDHRYYIKHRRPNSKIGKLETKISDLQSQLSITEKALELACETLQDINFKLYNTEVNFVDYFKARAKEMLENE